MFFLFPFPFLQSGTITFMTESLDAQNWKTPAFLAATQSMSTFGGLLFPIISGTPILWYTVMAVSVTSFVLIYPRTYLTRQWMQSNVVDPCSFAGRLIVTANKLRCVMLAVWSLIVLNFFVFWLIEADSKECRQSNDSILLSYFGNNTPTFFLRFADHQFRVDAADVCDCLLDCLSKLVFTAIIIDMYEMCLDNSQLIEQNLAELTEELNIIWNHSSDVLIIVVEKDNSSSFSQLFGGNGSTRRNRGPLEWHLESPGTASLPTQQSNLTLRASPSLLQLTGLTELQNFQTSEFDADQSELEAALHKAWVHQDTDEEGKRCDTSACTLGCGNLSFEFSMTIAETGITKECELVINKMINTGTSTIMVAVARDVSNRKKHEHNLLTLKHEQENNLIARETAHTVKNLNTTAHHKLLELLDEVKYFSSINLEEHHRLHGFEVKLRQTMAIMMTAAQQTYQLSRVGEILKGEAQHLTVRVSECTR